MSEESETTATPEQAQKASSYFSLMIFITLIIALVCIAIGVGGWQKISSFPSGKDAIAVFLVIGFAGVFFSTYMVLQTRKRVMKVSLELPPVMTTIMCQKCGFKNQRVFERGDYVFKDAGPCPKCNNTLLVSAIYREVKEKPKKEMF